MFKRVMFKRIFSAATLTVALTVGVVAPTSAAGNDVTRQTDDVSFVISAATCDQLPDGMTVEGSGSLTAVVKVREKGGVTYLSVTAQASGTATDNLDNEYQFHYANVYNAANSVAQPAIFNGTMVDQFSLSGGGPANFTNGFSGTTYEDTSNGTFLITSTQWVHGDPITFPVVTSRCDPL